MVGILASFIKNSSHYLKIIILLFVISQSRLAVRFSVKCEYYICIVQVDTHRNFTVQHPELITFSILFYWVQSRCLVFTVFLVMSFLFCFPEKEQSINRAGIVQEDIQPAGILDSCVCIDCFKDILEIRPKYLYGFK